MQQPRFGGMTPNYSAAGGYNYQVPQQAQPRYNYSQPSRFDPAMAMLQMGANQPGAYRGRNTDMLYAALPGSRSQNYSNPYDQFGTADIFLGASQQPHRQWSQDDYGLMGDMADSLGGW